MAIRFASDEFYNRLRREFYSDNNWEVHEMMRKLIEKKIRQEFSEKEHLWRDMYDRAADCILVTDMRDFLENDAYAFAPDREYNRNYWFLIRVLNRGRDVLRKENRHSKYVEGSLDRPIDSEDSDSPSIGDTYTDPTAIDPLEALLQGERLEHFSIQLFSLSDTKPEKIIVTGTRILTGYVFNCYSSKSLNKTVAESLNGNTLFSGIESLKNLLKMLSVQLHVLDPLNNRLCQTDETGSKVGMRIFALTPETVTDYLYSTRQQLFKRLDSNILRFPSTRKDGKKK